VNAHVANLQHPSHAHRLPRLVDWLGLLVPSVVADPDPEARQRSPWRPMVALLRALGPSHLLVVEGVDPQPTQPRPERQRPRDPGRGNRRAGSGT